MRIHIKQICPLCKQKFQSRGGLRYHLWKSQAHLHLNLTPSKFAKDDFPSTIAFTSQVQGAMIRYSCGLCFLLSETLDELADHLHTHHSNQIFHERQLLPTRGTADPQQKLIESGDNTRNVDDGDDNSSQSSYASASNNMNDSQQGNDDIQQDLMTTSEGSGTQQLPVAAAAAAAAAAATTSTTTTTTTANMKSVRSSGEWNDIGLRVFDKLEMMESRFTNLEKLLLEIMGNNNNNNNSSSGNDKDLERHFKRQKITSHDWADITELMAQAIEPLNERIRALEQRLGQ